MSMHTDIYCTTLDNLGRAKAIRAIHQAYLQLRAIGAYVEDFNNQPAMDALVDCLKDAGHPGFKV